MLTSNTTSTNSANVCLGLHDQFVQNCRSWPNFTTICERYLVSDRIGAAIANAALQDAGVSDETEISMIIDQSYEGNAVGTEMKLPHRNELPLQHLFTALDGNTRSPESFLGKLQKF